MAYLTLSDTARQVAAKFASHLERHALYGHRGFSVAVWAEGGELVLGDIKLPLNQRRCGYGSAILSWLTDRADEAGVVIRVEPVSTRYVRHWYRKHGFFPIGEMGEGGPVWKRRPKTPSLPLTQERLRLIILEQVTRFRESDRLSPEGVNSGACETFALTVIKRALTDHVISEGDSAPEMMSMVDMHGHGPLPDYKKLCEHYVMEYQGLFYDSETPEGVLNSLDIPVWARASGRGHEIEPRYDLAEMLI